MSRKLTPEEIRDRYPLRLFPGIRPRVEKLAVENHTSINRQINLLMLDSLDRLEKEVV